MSSQVTQQIKDKIDIVDLIGSYIKLQKAGVNYRARCPFHNEKSASFYISPERGIWHCFGCSVGGDIFSFIQQIEGVEFPEALRQLADRAAVKLEQYENSNNTEIKDNKNILYAIVEASTKFFEKQLWQSNAGAYALKYLRDRGMADETIKLFRLGYAPQTWDGLSSFLSQSFDQSDIIASGVAIKRDKSSGYYDRFRSRIMFPISDIGGRVVGFSGRIFHLPNFTQTDQEEAKYINTPQTAIYDKSRTLYGLDKAKLKIRNNKRSLVVEGNVDVIMSHQAGADFAIATCGTALTEYHLDILKRYADQVDLCFDADNAGINATEKAIQLCIARGLKVHALVIDDQKVKDPADYVKQYGDKWKDVVMSSKPFLEYIYETYKSKLDFKSPEGKKKFCNKLLPYVGMLKDRIERQSWVGRVALATRLSEVVINEEISKLGLSQLATDKNTSNRNFESPIIENSKILNLDRLEESLITLVLVSPDVVPEINSNLYEFDEVTSCVLESVTSFKVGGGGDILDFLKKDLVNKNNPQVKLLTSMLDILYVKSQELWSDFSKDALKSQFDIILRKIQSRDLNKLISNLQYDIRLAEQDNDRAELSRLLSEFTDLSRKLSQLGLSS